MFYHTRTGWYRETSLSPPVKKKFTDRSKVMLLLWVFCYLCFVFALLSCLFIAALWSPTGKGLASWLSCVLCFIVFCHFPLLCYGSGVVLDCMAS